MIYSYVAAVSPCIIAIIQFYEVDSTAKITATSHILELTREPGNLEALIGNEALMGALSRTLGEEYKKSGELVANIMRIFWSVDWSVGIYG